MDESEQQEREEVTNTHEIEKNKNCRRKSFEVWLTDKEKQIIREMNMKAMKREEAAARKKAERRKSCHHAKTYEEWLNEKSQQFEVKKHTWLESHCDENKKGNERRRISQDRYEKWLFEKEMQALRREQQKLQEAERKAIELRRKYLENEIERK